MKSGKDKYKFHLDSKQRKTSLSSIFFGLFTSAVLLITFPIVMELKRKPETLTVRPVEFLEEIPTKPIQIKPLEELPAILLKMPPVTTNVPSFELDTVHVKLDVNPSFESSDLGINKFKLRDPNLEDFTFQLHQLDENPRLIKQGPNNYPRKLKRQKIEARVLLKVEIDKKGKLTVIDVLEFSDKRFVDAAKKWAESSIYTPPKKAGKTVKTMFNVPVLYKLKN